MTIRTKLAALERAAASMPGGDAVPITIEEFRALPAETKIAYLRGQIRFVLSDLPPAPEFRGNTIEEYRAYMADWMAACGESADSGVAS
jgi:hypothetical protein